MITKDSLAKIEQDFKIQYKEATTTEKIEELRIRYLGRNQGLLQKFYADIPKLANAEKKELVPELNSLKQRIESIFAKQKPKAKEASITKGTADFYKLDPTSPGLKPNIGHPHPTIQVIDEIKEIFAYLGFDWMDGPEVEFDSYNFQKLRLHKDHPARDAQQTYYINEDILLRTHTSSMQIRYMENNAPPIRIISPGRVFL